MRKYRFFFHYHRHGEKQMTIVFRGKSRLVDDIDCKVPCETKWNKNEPKLVMRGYANYVYFYTLNKKLIAWVS